MLRTLLTCLAGISLAAGLHLSTKGRQAVTAEDYLNQLTESVDAEIDENTMMGHKPPNRWYYSADTVKNRVIDTIAEKEIAVLIVKHFNYLIHLRRKLERLNNRYPGKLDLWPLQDLVSAGVLEGGKNNGSAREEAHGSRFVGWTQPEWMDDIFQDMEGMRSELEDMLED